MRDEERIADILGRWRQRREAGETAEAEQLLREHPELAEHIAAERLLDEELPGTDEATPRRIGDFGILRELGRGGMGVVYEAEQISMRRKVALKVLPVSITSTPQAVKRFQREAHAAGKLHHTNIVPIHAMGRHAGHWYYAMELVEGRPLSDVIAQLRRTAKPTEEELARVARGREPTSSTRVEELDTDTGHRSYFLRVAETFAAVADGLQLAHVEGVVHRDIKPSNLLLDADGTLKIVDFGLAHVDEAGGPAMTVTGDLLGTPAYMSPEQATGKRRPADHRTDVYSLGATLYELLTLTPPFEGESVQELCAQIANRDPVAPGRRNPKTPRDLETIVLKAMEKDPDRRYQSAGELARDLRRFVEGAAIQARRIGPVERTWRKIKRHKLVAALVLGLLVLGVGGGIAGLLAAHERERRLELVYANLCAEGDSYLTVAPAPWLHDEEGFVSQAREVLSRAIELLPDRPEAYLGRALAGGSLKVRLADIERARARGLAPRTYHLARAYAYERSKMVGKAEEERRLVADVDDETPLDAYFEARLLATVGKNAEARQLLGRALDSAPRWSAVRYLALRLRGQIRSSDGDYSLALADLHGVQGMDDPGLDLRIQIASLWHSLGNQAEGDRVFRDAVDEVRRKGSAADWTALCRACRWSEKTAWLDEVSEEALRLHSDDPDVIFERICTLGETPDGNELLALAEQGLAPAPHHHGCLEAKAEALLSLGKRAEAVEVFRAALESRPRCYGALRGLGIALARTGKFEKAIEVWGRAADVKPDAIEMRLWRGEVQRNLGRADQGLASFNEALEIDPDSVTALFDRGSLYADAFNDYEKALADFRRAAEIDPSHFDVLRCCGIVLKLMGRFEQALDALQRAEEIQPKASAVHSLRGDILFEMGKPQEALAAYNHGVEVAPEDLSLRLDRGTFLCDRLHRFEAALDDFRKAAETDNPTVKVRAYFNQAVALRGLHRVDEAVDALDKAIRCDERDPTPCSFKGDLLESLDDFEGAIAAYEMAKERAPMWPRPRHGMVLALRRLGRFALVRDEARECLERWPADRYLQDMHVHSLRAIGEAAAARDLARQYMTRGAPKEDALALAYLYAVAGEADRACQTLGALDLDATGLFHAACVHAVLGDAETALRFLAEAAEAGYRDRPNSVPDPDLEALLGGDRRYREIDAKLRHNVD